VSLERRLRRLETPTHLQYLDARERAMAHVIRSFGVGLEPHEKHDLGPDYGEDNFTDDCEVLDRYRASLAPEKRKREQSELLKRLYRELEKRGVDPHMDDVV
jgi:hypothetical protein